MTINPKRPNPTAPSRGLPFWVGAAATIFMVLAALALAACVAAADRDPTANYGGQFQYGIATYHDDAREVTCWLYEVGISCLPDSQLGAAITNEPLVSP